MSDGPVYRGQVSPPAPVTSVTISGTVPVSGGLTDTQLRASPVSIDGSGVIQPVSAASLPLPTGAATAARQTTPGTAGTPSVDVITVQGAPSASPIPIKTDQNIEGLLGSILTELRVVSTILQVGLSVRDDPADLRADYCRQIN